MKRKVLLLFILALVTLIVVGWLGRNAINRSIRSVEQASAPNPKLLLIREMFQDLLDAESSVRTYTITDDRNALNSFDKAEENVESKLSKLQSVSTGERQQAILNDLDSLVDTKFQTLRRLIRIKEAGSDSSVLDKIRADIQTLRTTDKPEQIERIRDLYLDEENSREDYERLFGDSHTADSLFEGSVRQDMSSKQLEKLLTELSERENEIRLERQRQELQLTRFDSRLMEEIRSEVNDFEAIEARITESETDALREASQNAKTFITSIMIGGLILFAVMLLIIFNDISQSIRNREQLRKAKDEAERLARVKEDFLSNMSHEIRTPLNAVIGFAEQLSSSSLSRDQQNHVGRIQRSGKHLQQLINDILDYTKLESGKVTLEKIGFSPSVSLEETVELFEKQAADKNQPGKQCAKIHKKGRCSH
ncbi:MAG: histidine kinase dimerization/phospho-acceptor domain-containing protein [Cyclobacteriaceae bacterium]